MEPIEQVTATQIVIRVDGFQDARHWMYRIMRAGIATCSSCDKPATHIYWQDQAEWYFECNDHYTAAPMWSGHTRWSPDEFSKRVIPERAKAWIAQLEPDEQQRVRLEEYNATNWYDWIVDDDWRNPDTVVLRGTIEWGTAARIRPLKNGQFAYQIEQYSPGYSYMQDLHAPFDSREDALTHARQSIGVKAQ